MVSERVWGHPISSAFPLKADILLHGYRGGNMEWNVNGLCGLLRFLSVSLSSVPLEQSCRSKRI